MSEELDQLEADANQRATEIQKAEADMLEALDQKELIELWNNVKTRVHCEKFIQSRTGKKLVERLMRDVIDAGRTWLLADDPLDKEVIKAHRRAQAAHTAIFVIDEILKECGDAEQELNRIAQEIGE